MNKLVRVVAGGCGEGGLYGFKHSGEPDVVVNLLILWNLYAFMRL
jgi:hypothetical protein